MKRVISLVIVVIMLLTTVVGCSQKTDTNNGTNTPSTPARTEVVIQDSDWVGVDLFAVTSWNDMQSLLADTVIARHPETGETVPSICSDFFYSEDGKTLTFTIPEGLKYSTGEQVEPEDFIASVEYGREVSEFSYGYDSIESMEIDGRNVICHLSSFKADMEFFLTTSFFGLIDKDEIENMSKDEKLWGCHPYGPYYLEEYSPGAYAVLKANPYYKTHMPFVENKGVPKIDKVTVKFAGEDFTFLTGIQNGDYDVLAAVSMENYNELTKDSSIVLKQATTPTIRYFEFNVQNDILADDTVRRAIIHGINRDDIGTYTDDFSTPVYSLIIDSVINYSAEAEEYYKKNYNYDPELSKKLLAEAGWKDTDGDGFVDKNGQKLSFEFKSRDTNDAKLACQAIQLNMKDIGIDMEIVAQDWSYVNEAVVSGNFDAGFLSLGWGEPFLLLNRFCGRNPYNNLRPEEYKALVDKAAGTVDYDERTDVITEALIMLYDMHTIVPLYQDVQYRAIRSELKGVITSPSGGFYLNDAYY